MRSDDGSPMTGEKNSFSAYNDVARLADDTIEVRDRKHPVDDSPPVSFRLPTAECAPRQTTSREISGSKLCVSPVIAMRR